MNKKMIRLLTAFVGVLLFASAGMAKIRNFQKVTIPDAYCGNGDPYKILVDIKNTRRLAVEFMGGGACWSKPTCFGKKLRAVIFPLGVPLPSLLSGAMSISSPIDEDSLVYFPYCTGDVFAGDHTAQYEDELTVQHRGYSNVVKAIRYLQDEQIVQFDRLDEITLYGSSAGGIAALVHAKNFETFLRPRVKKTIVSDSPGLHFGKTFWHKFTDELIHDYSINFGRIGIQVDVNDGNVARQITSVCRELGSWRIGFLQGSRDLIMSSAFGDITPEEHEKLVYGPEGIYTQTGYTENCFTWAPKTKMHTFLLASVPISLDGISAMDFTQLLLFNQPLKNFK